MQTGQDNNDGSDIFWPGYVDATTNLILNLLFLLTILIVAVFMFALELGRTSKVKIENPPLVTTELISTKRDGKVVPKSTTDPVKQNIELKREIQRFSKMLAQLVSIKHDGEVVPTASTDPVKENIKLEREIKRLSKMLAQLPSTIQGVEATSKATTDHAKENIELKREIKRLNKMLAHQVPQNVKLGGLEKNLNVTKNESKPVKGLDKVHISEFDIVVSFKDESIAFTPEEREQLLETLKPVVAKGKSNIYVEVPAGFSEAKRMGFYRAMAVRNLLIEMKVPKENINVSVVEGKNDANASIVMIK